MIALAQSSKPSRTPSSSMSHNVIMASEFNCSPMYSRGRKGEVGSAFHGTVVQSDEDFLNLTKKEKGILIPSDLCNDRDISRWDVSPFVFLQVLRIQNHCFSFFHEWSVSGLLDLQELTIGERCFTQCQDPPSTCKKMTFEVKSCPKLTTIKIGSNSFIEWGKCSFESTIG